MKVQPFKNIVIYGGHKLNPYFGPYPENILKRINMFNYLKEKHHRNWDISVVEGENLLQVLKKIPQEETLLVMPAGQSSRLDKVFSKKESEELIQFFETGGRGYFNCGSAYWVSEKRIYKDLCEVSPDEKKPLVKGTQLPLFKGVSEGPLCPFPGEKYKVGFFSDAVRVESEKHDCCVYLSGGGYFSPREKTDQKIKVLAKYHHEDLIRVGVAPKECVKKENAVIMASIGKGGALLSMFHPYYGPQDFDIERYEKAFPDCGTDWRAVKSRLSSRLKRMEFAYYALLSRLERLDFL